MTELITELNIDTYLPFLSAVEYYGLSEGNLTALGVSGEGEPEGILIFEIMPEFIRINRLATSTDGRKARQDAEILIKMLTEKSDEFGLPVYYFSYDFNKNIKLLIQSGFKEEESRYSYISGKVKDMAEIPAPDRSAGDVRIITLASVDEETIRNFILSTPHDTLLQFAGTGADTGDLSEASLLCVNAGGIAAALFLREKDDFLEVSWTFSENESFLKQALGKLKKQLVREEGEDYELRFLSCMEEDEERFGKYFNKSDLIKLHIMKYGG